MITCIEASGVCQTHRCSIQFKKKQIPGRLDFDLLAPDGKSVITDVLVTDGPNYKIATCYFPLARADGRPLNHTGGWKMVIRRSGSSRTTQPGKERWVDAVDYRSYLIADIPEMDFDVRFGKRIYRAGEAVTLHVSVMDNSEPVRTLGKINAEFSMASANFGDLVSKFRTDNASIERVLNQSGDQLADRAEAKFRLALTDASFARRLQPTHQGIELFDDGNAAHGDSLANDGVYSANVGRADVPGLIAADISLTGQTPRSRDFSRRYRVSTLVRHSRFEQGESTVSASPNGSRDGNWIVGIKVTPIDASGNYLGPGYRDRLTIEVPVFAADSPIQDQLDGSYTRNFLIPLGSLGTNAKVAFEGELIFSGSVREAFLRGWICTLLILLILLAAAVITVWLMKRKFRKAKPVS